MEISTAARGTYQNKRKAHVPSPTEQSQHFETEAFVLAAWTQICNHSATQNRKPPLQETAKSIVGFKACGAHWKAHCKLGQLRREVLKALSGVFIVSILTKKFQHELRLTADSGMCCWSLVFSESREGVGGDLWKRTF
eukprot:5602480-Amphidinium_carterae.1